MAHTHVLLRRSMALGGLALGALALAGCSANFGSVSAISGPVGGSATQVTLRGQAYGGQQPVTGSRVQLWVAGTTGYGSAATALGSPVTTNTNGGFTLGTYTCPANSYAYITASGGDPQIGSSQNNKTIALVAALGPCANLSSTTFININEVTTVAAVWALQAFAGQTLGTTLYDSTASSTTTPAFTFGTSSTNTQGLANAMNMAALLANTSTGTSPGTNSTGNAVNVEYWQVNALANILALCVNSTGTSSASCAPVVSATTASGSSAPADVAQVALFLARNPTQGTGLLANIPATAPFPVYSTTVNDWTIGASFQTSGTNSTATTATGTRFVAPDQFGNIWVAANTGVEELDPTGNVLSTTSSFTSSGASKNFATAYQVAVDKANNAWVTDQTANFVVELPGSTAAGVAGSGTVTAIPSLAPSATEGIAVDGNNNVWYGVHSGGKLYEIAAGTTTPVAGTASTTNYPYGVAVDMSNNPTSPNYTVSNGGSFVLAVNDQGCANEALGGTTTGYGGSVTMAYTVAGSSTAAGAATPLSPVANAICNTTSKVATQSITYNGGSVTANFMSTPAGIAVDRGNNYWVVNQNYVTSDTSGPHYSLTRVAQNYSTSFTAANINTEITWSNVNGGGLSTPWFLAFDGNNNAWVSNAGGATNGVSTGVISLFNNAGTALAANGLYGGTYALTNNGTTTTYRRALVGVRGIAVDGSGNVWTANSTTFTFPGATAASGFVTVVVGGATPTVTPLARGVANYTLATQP